MNVIPRKTHAVIDYVFGIVLIVSPFLFNFADGGPAQWTPILVGVVILASSLMTNYEISITRVIPMPVHLGVDVLGGLVLLASPWLFHFSDRVYLPHVVFGILEVGIAAMTQRQPSFDVTPRRSTGSLV